MPKTKEGVKSRVKTDIMIIKSFQITANVIGNLHYRNVLKEMAQKIKKGGKINEVVAESPKLFPPVVTSMIAVGEETGELDNILLELAESLQDINEFEESFNKLDENNFSEDFEKICEAIIEG